MTDASSLNGDDAMDPCCMGCGSIIEEGNVVAFGDGIWHVQCFVCAKCHTLVEHDSNLLLLSDGNPICENCSYRCHVCRLPISDETIMTGDESFHVECFRCRLCQRKIEDLVFAKTSQGIYCMSCHNDRISKSKRIKERERENTIPIPQKSLEKSLPSLPQNPKRNNLQPPTSAHSLNTKRSFERPDRTPKIAPRTSIDNIPKAHTLPPNGLGLGLGRRQSRILDGVGDVLKNKVTTSATKAFEQFTARPSNSDKTRGRSDSESSKRSGFFSKKSDSIDNSSRLWPTKNRNALANAHSRNLSITSSRSDPLYNESGRTFSISSQRSDFSEPFYSKKPATTPPGNSEFDQNSTNKINFDAIPTQTSPTQSGPHSPNSPRSASPTTPHSISSTSPRSPPSPIIEFEGSSFILDGPPILPPLSFSNNDADDLSISAIVDNIKLDRKASKRRSKMLIFSKNKKVFTNGVEAKDSGDERSAISRDRKNSESSTGSSDRESEVPTVILESDDTPDIEDLKQELLDTQKNLAQAECSLRNIKRASHMAFSEYNEEYNKQVSLRKEAETNCEKLRARIALQSQQLSDMVKEKEEMEKTFRDAQVVKQQLKEMQENMKELDVQKELIIKEIEGLAKEKQAGLAVTMPSTPESAKDLPVSLARHISTHLDQVKRNYLLEITQLQTERDALKQEAEHFRNLRDQYIEEAQNLNSKNLELAEMNNELARQIDHNSKAKANNNGFNFFRGIKVPGAIGVSEANNMSWSNQNFYNDSQVSTTKLVTRNSIGRGETPKKLKWKKGNVFNKLLSQNTSPDPRTHTNGAVSPTPSSKTAESRLDNRPDNRSEHVPYKKTPNLLALNQEQRKLSSEHSSHRSHNWQQTSFLRPTKCENCQEKMWGSTETRCNACGICCHTKCSALIFGACSGTPGTLNDIDLDSAVNGTTNQMFGTELVKQLELENREIPLIVEKCVKAVEARGIDFEGIYRKPGGASQMRTIITGFERGDVIDLDDPDEFNDIGAVTSVLKQYLRQLPDSLTTFDLYPKFLEIPNINDHEEKLEKTRNLLSQLPKENYATLKYLMQHLSRVKANATENLMTAKNLAVVFGPTLLRGPNPGTEILDMNLKNMAIEFIIQNTEILFLQDDADQKQDGFI